jgi:hypothetical protein
MVTNQQTHSFVLIKKMGEYVKPPRTGMEAIKIMPGGTCCGQIFRRRK